MAKKYTYHKYHSFTEKDGSKFSCITQQYQIGVYAIINGNSALQFNWTPSYLVKLEKKLKKKELDGKISDLNLEHPITVVDNGGLWKEC